MPRASLMAGTAAYALVRIDAADTALVRVNRLHRAGVAAGRIFALTAGVREVGPVVFGVQAVSVAAGIQVAGHLDAGNVAGAAAVVGQGAVDFAALTAHAAIRIHDEQTLRESPYANLILGYRLFRVSIEVDSARPARLLPESFRNCRRV